MKATSYLMAILAGLFLTGRAWGCACGCDVLEVGQVSMFPSGAGGLLHVDYAYQNQNTNWSGSSKASPDANNDKKIETQFIMLGVQYMFSTSWGIRAELPYALRSFSTLGGDSGADPVTINWGDIGDLRLEGVYTGFSKDLSTGVTFGFKLPSGNDSRSGADRDTQLGSGSTDLLLGAYHVQKLDDENLWNGFVQIQLDLPFMEQDGYRPGTEVDAVAGVQYNGFSWGKLQIKPMAQVIGSYKGSDSGANAADPVASGLERILLSPGLELDLHPFMVHAAAEFTAYDYVVGNQLMAPVIYRLGMTLAF